MSKPGWKNWGDHQVEALFAVVGGVMAVVSFALSLRTASPESGTLPVLDSDSPELNPCIAVIGR